MKVCIVGGDVDTGKPSGVMTKIYGEFHKYQYTELTMFNGILPPDLAGQEIVLWFPNISNEKPKDYPTKDKGACLICSKVIHGGRTEVDAVSRIFGMHGNAVVAIYKDDPQRIKFKLIDALGNPWVITDKVEEIVSAIMAFWKWSAAQLRFSLEQSSEEIDGVELEKRFVELNSLLAYKIQSGLGIRYFGNFSTRCMKLFPCARKRGEIYAFSPRNIDKRHIGVKDFVLTSSTHYYGERKPSVDAPVQISIFEEFPDVNYMIHGHASIEDVVETKNYYPCGDLREVAEVVECFKKGHRVLNLKNHGFLIASKDIDGLEEVIKSYEFKPKALLR